MEQPKIMMTNLQLTFVLISVMLGVRFMLLPRVLVETSDSPDAWISPLINFPLVMIAAAIAALLARTFAGRSLFEYLPDIVGKAAGMVLSAMYIIYFIFYSATELRVVGEIIRYYLLPDTPLAVNMLALLMAVIYLVMGGVVPLVRIQLLFLPIVLVSLVLVLLIGFQAFDPDNVQPLLANGILPIIRGVPANTIATLGFGTILAFGAYIKGTNGTVKAVCWGVGVVLFLNSLVVFISIGVFGEQALQSIVFPVMELVKSVEAPGGFFERIELLFLTVFIMTIFATIAIGLFVSALGVSKLLKTKLRQNILVLSPIMMLIAVIPRDISQEFALGQVVEVIGIILEGAVPAILLFIVKSQFPRLVARTEDSSKRDKRESA